MTFLPKEHGAYGQMAFPLVTALLVSGASVATLAWMLAVAMAFVAHEPALVLLGHRGARARRERGPQAAVAAAITGAVALAAAAAAVLTAPAAARWAFAVPAIPALVVALLVAVNREKSAAGELAVAITFSLAAIPAALGAGAAVSTAVAIGLVFSVVFTAAVLAVRTVILGVRGGGNPDAVRATCIAIWWVSAAAVAGLWWTSSTHRPASIMLGAVTPAIVFALAITFRRPPPSRLKALGWSIVGVSTLATLVLVAGF
ncbi:MAG: YwiC-like family protein [Acidobacteria bacterium]|nr:YwiC-like family protein [Acidobacteriota bacterium]